MFTIINKGGEIKLDLFLKNLGISSRTITKLRKNFGNIKVNDEPCFTNHILKHNDIIHLRLIDTQEKNYPTSPEKIEVLFEDKDLLIVNKPSGCPTIPTINHYLDTLAGRVLFYAKNKNENYIFRALNRLDIDTAGIVIIAKNVFAYDIMDKGKTIKKKYMALLDGKLTQNGKIDMPIMDNADTKKQECNPNGKQSVTNYQAIKYYENINATLVEFSLETGRTNQIRVHSAYIGHPLSADTKYGSNTSFLPHFYLNCYYAKFIHPQTKKEIEITTNMNLDDLEKNLKL